MTTSPAPLPQLRPAVAILLLAISAITLRDLFIVMPQWNEAFDAVVEGGVDKMPWLTRQLLMMPAAPAGFAAGIAALGFYSLIGKGRPDLALWCCLALLLLQQLILVAISQPLLSILNNLGAK